MGMVIPKARKHLCADALLRSVQEGVIAPFPGYELLKSPFPEFAFSLGGDLVIVKQWLIKNPVCERLSKNQRLACRYDEN